MFKIDKIKSKEVLNIILEIINGNNFKNSFRAIYFLFHFLNKYQIS